MKHLKKILAAAMALFMTFAITGTALAAEGDITVNGAIQGATYEAHLVFDATYDGNAVSYTIPANSTIANVTDFNTVFSTKTNGGKTYVTKAAGVSDEAVIAWFKNNQAAVKTATGAAKATVENTAGANSITLATGGAGYYIIYSTNGENAAVTIDTAHPTATVNSKLESSPVVPNDAKKINGKSVDTMAVGEEATFTVNFTATNYAMVNGTQTAITSYTITDTPNGFAINEGSVSVKVNNGDYTIGNVTATVSDAGVLTVTIPWDQTTYASPSEVVVTYTGTLTNKNLANESSNSVRVAYNENNDITPDNPPTVYGYNYTIHLTKQDADDNNIKLDGAKFVLKKGNQFYAVNAETGVVSWVDAQSGATEVTTDATGNASFTGLDAGTYTLVETEAPEGYNLAADTTIELAEVTEKLTSYTVLTNETTVNDAKGSTLPSTGGIGTTLFYVIGGILVAGAAIALVVKNRVAKEEK